MIVLRLRKCNLYQFSKPFRIRIKDFFQALIGNGVSTWYVDGLELRLWTDNR